MCSEDAEFCINMYDHVDDTIKTLLDANFCSPRTVSLLVPLVHKLVVSLRTSFERGFELKVSDLTKQQRGRLGIFTSVLCMEALNTNESELLKDALAVANITYNREDRYHELHYDLAVLRYCAHKLCISFKGLEANPPWGLTDELRERFDDIANRPLNGLLESFELQVSKEAGKYSISKKLLR